MPLKKAVKKVVKKLTKKKEETPEYNEYGVCIACQGGDPLCHHNNLCEGPDGLSCITCGAKV